ncbi:MAG: sugar ABC transporter ATP-binding protein [Treponema sp.]|jgi:ABC-type sugar transport system ATPase subunit|nr:sugar ABC transporter ATP-binding protein [Treponema sp.]
MAEVILSMKNITMDFTGVRALDNVSFDVFRGEILGLCGENGAGKSTLIKIVTGIYKQTKGAFYFKGNEMHIQSPLDAHKAGLSVVHQEIKLVGSLSVKENIFLGHPETGNLGLIDWKKMRRKTLALMDRLGVTINPDLPVETFSIAQQQIIEICKALSFQAELIIMDEPSATLTEKEVALLYTIIERLKQEGVTIIYISHRLEEVFKIANRVIVLRDGQFVGIEPIQNLDRNQLIKMMVGRELGQEFPEMNRPVAIEEILRVEHLARKGILHDINFSLRRGEILGLGGLVGAGRTEVIRAIIGLDKKNVSGSVYINGIKRAIKNPSSAIKNRIGTITEDRKKEGLVLDMTVDNNISLANINSILKHGLLSNKIERKIAAEYIQKLRIVTPSAKQMVINLSGGNQQKVIIAKWLNTDVDIYIFDEPTRGIDVGAKSEIYKIMEQIVMNGKSIIMISSEMPELIGMCDRILVMHNGRITGSLNRNEFTQEKILELAIQ